MLIHRAAPLHSIFVHFTIALVVTSLACDIAGRVFVVPSLLAAAWWTIAGAVPVTFVTVATGITSRRNVPIAEGAALRYLRVHTAVGPTFLGFLVAVAVWRAMSWTRTAPPSTWYLAALGAVTLLMTLQGYIGGELVYRFALGVHGRFAELPLHHRRARSE